eukprot:03506_2
MIISLYESISGTLRSTTLASSSQVRRRRASEKVLFRSNASASSSCIGPPWYRSVPLLASERRLYSVSFQVRRFALTWSSTS